MEKENIVLIRINGKNAAKKHAYSLKKFLQNNLPDTEKVEVLVEINKNFNFNVSIDGYEIFAKRKFWNRYPNYKTINNKIQEYLTINSDYTFYLSRQHLFKHIFNSIF